MTQKTIEDSYCFKDAEHEKGSNRYILTYNHQWRNIIHEHLTIAIRSVKLWRQPRNLWVDNLAIHDTTKEQNAETATSFDISITGSMTEFNNKMTGKMSGYRVYYNPKEKRIVFDCDEDHYFIPLPAPYTTNFSDDFKAITGLTNFSDYTIYSSDSNSHPTCIGFDNVWDREEVHIRASFVDLGYQNFLGVSNEQFIPPKEYPISFTDKKFSIELFDSLERPIELPSDECGGLVIEAIMKSTI